MSTTRQTLIISSELSELEKLEGFVDDIVHTAKVGEEVAGSIMLLLSEAVTNGILHGNKQDPKKKVTVEAELTKHTVVITVTDEGEGFNPEEVPDPLAEANLLKTGGRGVYLMREYADEVWYNEKGNQLKLTFQKKNVIP